MVYPRRASLDIVGLWAIKLMIFLLHQLCQLNFQLIKVGILIGICITKGFQI